MEQSSQWRAEALLVSESRASVWSPWYFKQSILPILTTPFFFVLVYCIAVCTLGAIIQGLALFRATYAIVGSIGVFMAVSVGRVPIILPPVLYYPLPTVTKEDPRCQGSFASLSPPGSMIAHDAVAWRERKVWKSCRMTG
jgi:hypothetical protein